jgi:hypothetical protein
MGSDLLRTFFRSGMFIVLLSIVLILAVPRDSAEFVISMCSLAIGVTLLALVALVNRMTE